MKTNKQKNHSLALAVLLAIATAHTPSAQAAVVYDNGVVPNSGFVSDVNQPQYMADNFTLTAGATTFNTVSWTGLYSASNTPQATDVFTIQLYTNNSGLPTTTPFATFAVGNAVARTNTGATVLATVLSFNVYRYTASIDSTSLIAEQMYWLSVFNNTTADTNDNWLWSVVTSGNGVASRSNPSGVFSSVTNRNMDFTLSNVPEPSAFLLSGLGLAGLTLARRRCKAA